MKRILFTLCLIMGCTLSFAASLKATGNIAVLKEKATAVLEIDYSCAIYREEHTFASEKKVDFPKSGTRDSEEFITYFNQSTPGMTVSASADGAKYKFLVELTRIRKKFGKWAPGSNRIELRGTVKVINIATGAEECVFTLKDFCGRDRYGDDNVYANTFAHLGEKIAQTVTGATKSKVDDDKE